MMSRRSNTNTSPCPPDVEEQKHRSRMFHEIGILRNFAKFTKTPALESVFNKVVGLNPQHRCFPVNFAKFLDDLLTEHLRTTASERTGTIL